MFIFHNANKLNEFAKSKELIKNVHVNIITVLVYTNYKKINTLGYLGKYQFGKSTLKTLKYKGSIKDFLNSSNIQENLMIKNLNYNKRRLRKTIKTYSGTIIDGVTITESGMLAAAHLSGQGNVKRFFRNGKNPKDAYGSSVTKYLKEFSGYNLNLK